MTAGTNTQTQQPVRRERTDFNTLLSTEFAGPVRLTYREFDTREKTVKMRRLAGNRSQIAKALDISEDDVPWIFPVASWIPEIGDTQTCYLRLSYSGKTINAVPVRWYELQRTGKWNPANEFNAQELEFEQQGRGWSTTIRPYVKIWRDFPVTPDADGKVRFAPRTVAVRRAMTATFWIAGAPEQIRNLGVREIDAFLEKPEEQYSFAIQVPILGRWYTAIELVGLTRLEAVLVDLDSIKGNLETMVANAESWIMDTLLPTIHPANINKMDLPSTALSLTDEAKANTTRLMEWLRGWAAWAVEDFRAKRKSGIREAIIAIPEPTGRSSRQDALMDWTPEQIIARLQSLAAPRKKDEAKGDGKTAGCGRKGSDEGPKGRRTERKGPVATAGGDADTSIGSRLTPADRKKLGVKEGPSFRYVTCEGCGSKHKMPLDFKGDTVPLAKCPKQKKGRKK